MKLKLISWNVRNFIRSQRVDLVCLQETKIQEMSAADARSLGVARVEGCGGRGNYRGYSCVLG